MADGSADDAVDVGYQSNLIDFGAVVSDVPPSDASQLSLPDIGPLMESLNTAAGDVIGYAVGNAVETHIGPAGEVVGEVVGDLAGQVLNDVFNELSEIVESQQEDTSYQSTLTEFGAEVTDMSDGAEVQFDDGGPDAGWSDGYQTQLGDWTDGGGWDGGDGGGGAWDGGGSDGGWGGGWDGGGSGGGGDV